MDRKNEVLNPGSDGQALVIDQDQAPQDAPDPRSRQHVLVVDDEESVRFLLKSFLNQAGYQCSTAASAEAALRLMKNFKMDVVITDILMPGLNGIELLERIKAQYASDVIVMTGNPRGLDYKDVIEKGASDFLLKPFRNNELLIRLKRVIRERTLIFDLNEARGQLQESVQSLTQVLNGTVGALTAAVEFRDPYTSGHQRRVTELSRAMAEKIGLPSAQIEGIRISGMLHDIGKISVPPEILVKPGKIDQAEFTLLKRHPQVGREILKGVDFPWPVADVVLQHHERMDGSGYPGGLTGEAIRIEARVLGVADVVEAMSSHRPYRPALGIEAALDEIEAHKGRLYDPRVVEACQAVITGDQFSF
ncbi:MAG: response regulator [Proteobacteria bacterium]|nr:response regulator [Pseudomonadota bacterium]